MGKRKKSKRLKLRRGSRLKLKSGNFARVLKTPKPNDNTVTTHTYKIKKWDEDRIGQIPFGHIAKVVRY
ncbi:MAG: hypothetical protein ACTSO3_01305 [Candidatus Heimdallarchaeaceae archaeon]